MKIAHLTNQNEEHTTDELSWNVIYHSVNANEIRTFNVFRHSGFMEDIRKHYKKCKTKEEFAEKLRSSLMYYFWSKCEWEIIISPWCGGQNTENVKADVYWQIQINWPIFLDYVWNARPQSRRKAQKTDEQAND